MLEREVDRDASAHRRSHESRALHPNLVEERVKISVVCEWTRDHRTLAESTEVIGGDAEVSGEERHLGLPHPSVRDPGV